MRDMGTVDTGSQQCPLPTALGLPVSTVPISPCGLREAMLQLFCSNLDCNHGASWGGGGGGALVGIIFYS